MAHKSGAEDGVKGKGRERSKGSNKARKSFELNGSYSSKHLRLREAEQEKLREKKAVQKENKKENKTSK